jgi:hypothetical protein
MLKNTYSFYGKESFNKDYVLFFDSLGKNGIVTKVISFQYIDYNFYNLGFGDYNLETQTIDDKAKSDNGDMKKVLATVWQSLEDFFAIQPNAIVFITGSDDVRNRFYYRLILNYAENFANIYKFEGVTNFEPLEFEIVRQEGKYQGFLISKLYL